MMVQVKLAKSGLEIYETQDTNIEQTNEEEEKEGFVLHNGKITEIAYYDNLMENSFEQDYEDIVIVSDEELVEIITTTEKIHNKIIN